MAEKARLASPIATVWTCPHGANASIDFGVFKVESGPIFASEEQAQTVVEFVMETIEELARVALMMEPDDMKRH